MAPNPKCIVCSEKPQVVVKIDTNRVTVKQFRDEVLIKALNMLEPDVITEGKGLVLISSEEGETDCNNDKKLNELEVVDGCILKVDDFVQQYELTVIIAHKEADREGDLYEVIADPDSLKPEASVDEKAEAPAAAAGASSSKETDNGEPKAKKARHDEPQPEDSDDDLCIIEDGAENDSNRPTTSSSSSAAASSSSSILGKHKADHQNNQAAGNSSTAESSKMDVENAPSTSSEPRSKRPRVEQDNDDDLIIIDDD